eukprot:TRINITY_DN11853_c0_g1_i1.p1 TRINITY_DN11853_c0_g1~~TRINITY_DN11853_c0_g1_i1.p1  ORF type:complete len:292 (+),score=66.30 TRINITY_DN11853_c0_g1_i1:94-969(+)
MCIRDSINAEYGEGSTEQMEEPNPELELRKALNVSFKMVRPGRANARSLFEDANRTSEDIELDMSQVSPAYIVSSPPEQAQATESTPKSTPKSPGDLIELRTPETAKKQHTVKKRLHRRTGSLDDCLPMAREAAKAEKARKKQERMAMERKLMTPESEEEAAYPPRMHCDILSTEEMKMLWQALPRRLRLREATKLMDTDSDGFSLSTLLDRASGCTFTILVLKDQADTVLLVTLCTSMLAGVWRIWHCELEQAERLLRDRRGLCVLVRRGSSSRWVARSVREYCRRGALV